MRVVTIVEQPSAALSGALQTFERQFSYPLGEGERFSISHGDDYARFFRAMGRAACFVAESGGEVIATLGAAIRELLVEGRPRNALYVGDLKAAPGGRRGRALLGLAAAAFAWARDSVDAAYSVVMDGTDATPDAYTGRLGIPRFENLGAIHVLRLDTSMGTHAALPEMADEQTVMRLRHALAPSGVVCAIGRPLLRSASAPAWLTLPQGRACGLLEDTRAAKRLMLSNGREMLAAHLTQFAYIDTQACLDMLTGAQNLSHARGFDCLFTVVRAAEAQAAVAGLPGSLHAGATIYGTGLPTALDWGINSSEI